MYRRRARANIVQRSVALLDLRLDLADHDCPDGTLRTLENLRPAGPVNLPYYTPTIPSQELSGVLGTIRAIGEYISETLTELIVVSSEYIHYVRRHGHLHIFGRRRHAPCAVRARRDSAFHSCLERYRYRDARDAPSLQWDDG